MKKCYFCLSTKDQVSIAVEMNRKFHVCEECVPRIKDQRVCDEAWASIVKRCDDPEQFTKDYDVALDQYNTKLRSYDNTASTLGKEPQPQKVRVSKKSDHKKAILKDLGLRIKEKVKDQDHVVDQIVPKILIHNLDIEKTKPLSFFFAGPTGVGKTELSIQLSEQLNIEFLKVDMSEYKFSHNVSRLIGSPPSYVGYGAVTPLEKLDGKKCVILLDEIEKAHPDIYDIFLQVLDKGVLTTGKGKEINLKEAIIVFTSNLGASEVKEQKKTLGLVTQEQPKDKVYEKAVFDHFKPEMINRMDGIFYFNSLSRGGLKGILEKFLNDLNQRLKKSHNVTLKVSSSMEEKILSEGFNPEMGARPLRRTLEKNVMELVASEILLNEQENGTMVLDMENGAVKVMEFIPEVVDETD